MFNIVRAQTFAGDDMFSAGKEFCGSPKPRKSGFTHTFFRFLLDDFVNGDRVVGVDPESKLTVTG